MTHIMHNEALRVNNYLHFTGRQSDVFFYHVPYAIQVVSNVLANVIIDMHNCSFMEIHIFYLISSYF